MCDGVQEGERGSHCQQNKLSQVSQAHEGGHLN